jgi:hypothetical protein
MFRDPLFKNKTMSLHMNWNREKTSKRLFLEQMGDWHVTEKCLPTSSSSSAAQADADAGAGAARAQSPSAGANLQLCCVDHPAPICHYRDLPSAQRCDSSPALKKSGGDGDGGDGGAAAGDGTGW